MAESCGRCCRAASFADGRSLADREAVVVEVDLETDVPVIPERPGGVTAEGDAPSVRSEPWMASSRRRASVPAALRQALRLRLRFASRPCCRGREGGGVLVGRGEDVEDVARASGRRVGACRAGSACWRGPARGGGRQQLRAGRRAGRAGRWRDRCFRARTRPSLGRPPVLECGGTRRRSARRRSAWWSFVASRRDELVDGLARAGGSAEATSWFRQAPRSRTAWSLSRGHCRWGAVDEGTTPDGWKRHLRFHAPVAVVRMSDGIHAVLAAGVGLDGCRALKKVLTGIEVTALLPHWLPSGDPSGGGGSSGDGER